MMKKYTISGAKGLFWCILFNGTEVCRLQGGMSFAVAVAAVEKLNTDDFFEDGWVTKGMEFVDK